MVAKPMQSRELEESILIIDDDTELCELITEYLESEGFGVEVIHEGTDAVVRAISGSYKLIILDVMLPGMNGVEVLRRIRSQSQIPVLMLTARGDEVDRIVGLEVGADDYLPKPFNPRELVARIRAILRRTHPDGSQATPPQLESLSQGDIKLDAGTRIVHRGGQAVELTTVEFELLELFLRTAGSVVKREELVERVLGRTFSPFDRSIDMHVSNLRKKLGPHKNGSERIKSIRSVGYLYTSLDESEEV
jgi:two-component system response regulator CpxR